LRNREPAALPCSASKRATADGLSAPKMMLLVSVAPALKLTTPPHQAATFPAHAGRSSGATWTRFRLSFPYEPSKTPKLPPVVESPARMSLSSRTVSGVVAQIATPCDVWAAPPAIVLPRISTAAEASFTRTPSESVGALPARMTESSMSGPAGSSCGPKTWSPNELVAEPTGPVTSPPRMVTPRRVGVPPRSCTATLPGPATGAPLKPTMRSPSTTVARVTDIGAVTQMKSVHWIAVSCTAGSRVQLPGS
jgi:hypothetical protein